MSLTRRTQSSAAEAFTWIERERRSRDVMAHWERMNLPATSNCGAIGMLPRGRDNSLDLHALVRGAGGLKGRLSRLDRCSRSKRELLVGSFSLGGKRVSQFG